MFCTWPIASNIDEARLRGRSGDMNIALTNWVFAIYIPRNTGHSLPSRGVILDAKQVPYREFRWEGKFSANRQLSFIQDAIWMIIKTLWCLSQVHANKTSIFLIQYKFIATVIQMTSRLYQIHMPLFTVLEGNVYFIQTGHNLNWYNVHDMKFRLYQHRDFHMKL